MSQVIVLIIKVPADTGITSQAYGHYRINENEKIVFKL